MILDPNHAVIAVRDVLWEQHTRILDTGKDTQNAALEDHPGGIAAIHAATLRAWGLAVCSQAPPHLSLQASDLHFAKQFLSDNGVGNMPLVAISPVASSPLKRWPVDRLAAVADCIIEENSCCLLFCGPQSDGAAELLNESRYADRIVWVGRIHLRRVAALLSSCAALVGNDTGLMHMAAAVGVPVVAIFGPTVPAIYLPPGGKAVSANIDCPYRKTKEFDPPNCVIANRCLIGRRSCIDEVDVAEVTRAVQVILWRMPRPIWRASAGTPA